jgi:hypothetical protein
MMAHEAVYFAGVTTATQAFVLKLGGRYMFIASGTFSTAAVQVEDAAGNFVDIFGAYDASAAEQNEKVATLSAAGAIIVDLPPGSYQFALTGDTGGGVNLTVARVPLH